MPLAARAPRAQLIVLVLALLAAIAACCTVVYVGPDATETGAAYLGHSSDGGADTDPRLVRIPARALRATRPVYPSPESYPRFVGDKEGVPEYRPQPGQVPFEPLGFVAEANATTTTSTSANEGSTFPYLEETYAIANGRVAFAESTCASALSAGSDKTALFSIDELTRVAAERAATARAAVLLMGDLAVARGFYGPWGGDEGSGESLIVADAAGDAWVFDMSSDDTGRSAVWAAQRVPRTHVAVLANAYSIRDIETKGAAPVPGSSSALASADGQFLFSRNMVQVAQRAGLVTSTNTNSTNSSTLFDFAGAYSGGEYLHKHYSGRRVWRVYSLLAPAQAAALPPSYGDLIRSKPYPATLPADKTTAGAGAGAGAGGKLLSLSAVTAVYRDALQGSQWDLTRGLAAGPFGSPERWTGGAGERAVGRSGWWERPIGLFRTSDSYVVELAAARPEPLRTLVWYAPHAPHGSVFAPFSPIVAGPVSKRYSTGVQKVFAPETAYWAHRAALNLAQMRYSKCIGDIQRAQQETETMLAARVAEAERALAAGEWGPAELGAWLDGGADAVVQRWQRLQGELLFAHSDGFTSTDAGAGFGKSEGYPEWWLRAVGYDTPDKGDDENNHCDGGAGAGAGAGAGIPSTHPRLLRPHPRYPKGDAGRPAK